MKSEGMTLPKSTLAPVPPARTVSALAKPLPSEVFIVQPLHVALGWWYKLESGQSPAEVYFPR